MLVIRRNAVKCLKCNDIIESNTVHDFRTCSCGAISVDGGHNYLRRCGKEEYMEDMSEVEEVEDLIEPRLPSIEEEFFGYRLSN